MPPWPLDRSDPPPCRFRQSSPDECSPPRFRGKPAKRWTRTTPKECRGCSRPMRSTRRSCGLPVPASGGTYSVKAVAQGTNGLADLSPYSSEPSQGRSSFSVSYLVSAPHLATDQGIYVAPSAPIAVVGSGFAAGEKVAISLAGTNLLTVQTDSSGSFPST